MSDIPNISTILTEKLKKEKIDENHSVMKSYKTFNRYYEGLLNKDDAHILLGMKLALFDCENAFQNIEDAEGFENTNFDVSKIDNAKLDAFINTDYDPFENAEDMEDLKTLSNETKIIMIIAKHIIYGMEMDANDSGVSYLESISDEDYERNIKNFFEGKDLNILEVRKNNVEDEAFQKARKEEIAEAKALYEAEEKEESDEQ